MKQARILNVLGLIFNLAIVGLVGYAVFGILGSTLSQALMYFTVLSNLFVALAALICIPFNIIGIAKGKRLPVLPVVLKLIGTVSVSVVLLVVVFLLAPQDNWNIANQFGNFSMTGGNGQFFLHLLVPVLSIISFIVFDHTRKLKFPVNFLSIIPLLGYSIFYILNYFFEVIPGSPADVYGFSTIGGSPVGGILIGLAILVGAFALSVIYWLLNGILFKEQEAANEQVEEAEPVEEEVEEVKEEPVEEAEEEAVEEQVEEEPAKEEAAAPVEEEVEEPAEEPVEQEVEEEPVEEPVEEAEEKEEVPEEVKEEKKPAKKAAEKKPAEKKTAAKKAPAKAEPKEEPKKAAAAPSKEGPTKVYHLTKRKEDNMWAITFVGGQKAVKLFKTKKEAEEALAVLTQNQGATALIRNSKGAKAGKFASSIKADKETK